MARLDFADLDQHGAEPSGDRRAHAALRQGESRIGDRAIEQLGFADEAEIDVLGFQVALGGEIRKRRALGEAIRSAARFLGVREHDLPVTSRWFA